MVCPKCKLEAVITSQKMVYSEEEKKLFRSLTYSCRNKKCDNYGKEISSARIEIPVETE